MNPELSPLAFFGGEKVRTRPFPAWPVFGPEEELRLLRVLRSGKWGKLHGDEVAEFERRFAALHGCKHGIAVVNGTVSLRIALMAAGIHAEDEVIVPPYTFLATATAVLEANAVPVFADIDLATFNLDPASVEAAITPRTRAIIPVHMAGQSADMDALMAVARKHRLTVIEDAAHAHGASYKLRPAGSLGHLSSFSFQSSKNLTSGEGGIVCTSDDDLAELCRSIHNCGRIAGGLWYEHHLMSGNYRLGEFQGAVLNAQLDRLEEQTQTRDRNGASLAAKLRDIPGIHPQTRPADCTRHSCHQSCRPLSRSAFPDGVAVQLLRRKNNGFLTPSSSLNSPTPNAAPFNRGPACPPHKNPIGLPCSKKTSRPMMAFPTSNESAATPLRASGSLCAAARSSSQCRNRFLAKPTGARSTAAPSIFAKRPTGSPR
jgi:dTDP-4-amino-4,6-dideoxygalactose transaminase